MQILRKILRGFAWFLLVVLTLVLLIFAAIQFTPVQNWLTDKVETSLRNQLDTDLGIGYLTLKFPNTVAVGDVYLNTPAGDTLARLGDLSVDISLWNLIKQEVIITQVDIADVYAYIDIRDSTSNIDFLLDAFVVTDSTAAANPDSTAAVAGQQWQIMLNDANLTLTNADVYYRDDPNGLLVDATVGNFIGTTESIDLEQGHYRLRELELHNADLDVTLGEGPEKTTTEPLSMLITGDRVAITDTHFKLRMAELDVATYLGDASLGKTKLTLSDNLYLETAGLQIDQSALRYDLSAPRTSSGIDYNHLVLEGIDIDLTDIQVRGDTIEGVINELSAREQSGLALQHTEGKLLYTPQRLSLSDFVMRTGNSVIEAPQADVWYDFTGTAPLEEMRIRVDVNGDLAVSDILALAPDLASVDILAENRYRQLTFTARASGDGRSILVDRLNIDGPGLLLRSEANIRNPFDPNRIGGRLQIDDLIARPKDILPLLPPGILPDYIDWPDRLVARGVFNYANDNLDLQLFAIDERRSAPRNSRIDVQGTIKGVQAYPNTTFDLNLDTLLATREAILAYLPEGTLPPDYELPAYIRGQGSVSGSVDDLTVDVRVQLPENRTYAHVEGSIFRLTQPDSMRLDLQLSDLQIAAQDVEAFLPDTLLPANFVLPDLRTQSATIKGSLQDLTFDIPIETSNGNLAIAGRYDPKNLNVDLDMQDLVLSELFSGAFADSISTLDLRALRLKANVRGAIEPEPDLSFTAELFEKQEGQVMTAEGTIVGQAYAGRFAFTHPDFQAEGNGTFDNNGPRAQVDAFLDLQRVDLQRWDISENELYLQGRLVAKADGIDPRAADARIGLYDVALRGDTADAYIDSLVMTALLDNMDNKVVVKSDILTANLEGVFDIEDIGGEISRYIQGYWDEDIVQPEPVENGRNMILTIQVIDPYPFTTGFVPGLRDLSPFQLEFRYREKAPELVFNIELPMLNYAGIMLDSLGGEALGGDQFTYSFNWRNIDLPGQFGVGRTRLAGQTEQGGLTADIIVLGPKGKVRHQLATWIDPEADDLRLQLDPAQILNYEDWSMTPNNVIRLQPDLLTVDNWRLANGNQSMVLATPQPNDLEATFNNFNLTVLTRLVNTEEDLASGEVNGTFRLDNALAQPAIAGDLTIDSLTVLAAPMGNLRLDVVQQNSDLYDVDVALEGAGNDVAVQGSYRPSGSMDLTLAVDRLMLRTIDPFSLDNLRDSEGYATGRVELDGPLMSPTFNGQLALREAAITPSLLGARFQISEDPIVFNERTISIDRLEVIDARGNRANVVGELYAESLSFFTFDFEVAARDFLVIDSDAADNELYYGYLVVDADVTVTGNIYEPDVEVNASPKAGSQLTYRLPAAQSGQQQELAGIVTYADRYEWERIIEEGRSGEGQATGQMGLYLLLNLNVNDNLLFTVIINPLTGDKFTGRGEGDLTFVQYPNGRQEMVGQVAMVDGLYDYTYQGLINKRFEVEPGSNMVWTGDVINPNMDITINHEVRTSPYPLVTMLNPEGDAEAGLRRKQTFLVKIMLDGDLLRSNISTNITYPDNVPGNASFTSVESALSGLRNDPNRMNTQAFGLLLFGGFTGGESTGGNLVNNSVNAGLDRAITTQLNNLTNNLIGFVDLDFGLESYRDQGGQTQRNLRVSLRKSLFDDRLILSVDGVTGTQTDEIGNSQTYLDNITAEYLLNESGELRIKLFSDRDRNVLIGSNVVRLGGRLVFSKDFNTIRWFGGKNDDGVRREQEEPQEKE